MDRNGYNDSALPTQFGECFICGAHVDTARHEIFYGTANREQSKREGMWVNVCPRCHRLIHNYPDQYIVLKQTGQKYFERLRPRAEFVAIFGRNYLE